MGVFDEKVNNSSFDDDFGLDYALGGFYAYWFEHIYSGPKEEKIAMKLFKTYIEEEYSIYLKNDENYYGIYAKDQEIATMFKLKWG